jgi:hypothetical protein
MTHLMNAKTKVYELLQELKVHPVTEQKEKIEPVAREWAVLAKNEGSPEDELEALSFVCWSIAALKPSETVEIAQHCQSIPASASSLFRARVEDDVAVAYLHLGDAVRARQHRRKAIELWRETDASFDTFSTDASFEALLRATTYVETPLADSKKFTIELPLGHYDLIDWIKGKSQISIDDLSPRFGDFVTNDQQFFREATSRLEILKKRLTMRLNKPDNYLLIAEPGAGKSFFVREFKGQLEKTYGSKVEYIEKNLSAYNSIDRAFDDIVMDIIVALNSHNPVILFVDEVDTQIDGRNLFQRLIAPMNGDPFFFNERQISFAKQNLVVFYALSSRVEDINTVKWPDFLSRVPSGNRITLPNFKLPIERIYRAVSVLPKGAFAVERVQAAALLYIGLRNWASSRELEQAVELAKIRAMGSPKVLELGDLVSTWDDVKSVSDATNSEGFDKQLQVLGVAIPTLIQ